MLESRKLLWFGSNGELSNIATPTELDIGQTLPELAAKPNEFAVVRVRTAWSRSLSLTLVTFADLRHLKVPRVKLLNALGLLAQKWTSPSVEPPYVEALGSHYPAVALRKCSPTKARRPDDRSFTSQISPSPNKL